MGDVGESGPVGMGWGGGRGLVEGVVGCNFGGRGDMGYRGCEPKIEGIVQCTKRYCTILRKIKKIVCVCGGGGAIFEIIHISWSGRTFNVFSVTAFNSEFESHRITETLFPHLTVQNFRQSRSCIR